MDTFKRTLQELLDKNKGNQAQLARSLDKVVSGNMIGMILRGERGAKPSHRLIEKIKEKYGVDPTTGHKIVTKKQRKKSAIKLPEKGISLSSIINF